MSKLGKSIEIEGRLLTGRGRGRGELGLIMGSGLLLGVMEMLWNWITVMFAQPCEYAKNH